MRGSPILFVPPRSRPASCTRFPYTTLFRSVVLLSILVTLLLRSEPAVELAPLVLSSPDLWAVPLLFPALLDALLPLPTSPNTESIMSFVVVILLPLVEPIPCLCAVPFCLPDLLVLSDPLLKQLITSFTS